MNGIFEFLRFLENSPATLSNIDLYKHKTGRNYFEFCVEHGLVKEVGTNSLDEDLYGLTGQAENILNASNFCSCLADLEKENKI